MRLLATVLVFDRETDQFVREHSLGEADLPALRSLFDLEEDDPMTQSYPVEDRQADWLRPKVKERFDFARFAYFLETHPLA